MVKLLILLSAYLVATVAVDTASIGFQGEQRGLLISLFGRPCRTEGWTQNGNEECYCSRLGFIFFNFQFTRCRPIASTTSIRSSMGPTRTIATPIPTEVSTDPVTTDSSSPVSTDSSVSVTPDSKVPVLDSSSPVTL